MQEDAPTSVARSILHSSSSATDACTVSLIIPVYNHASLLSRALRSALEQTFSSLEVIVVDDGSTDNSQEVARSFEPAVRVVCRKNGGLSAARNSGIQTARGDILIFLDADDWLEPEAVARLVAEFEGSHDATADLGIVACRANQIDEASGTLLNPPSAQEEESSIREITWQDLLLSGRRTRFPCSALVRREVFLECGGFDEDYGRLGSEDRDMWLRASMKYRIVRIPDRLLNIAVHDTNMSADPARQLPGMRRCLSKARSSGQVSRWHLPLWARVYSHYFLQAARMHRDRGNRGWAFINAFASLLSWPIPALSLRLGYPAFTRLRVFLVCGRDLLRPSGSHIDAQATE